MKQDIKQLVIEMRSRIPASVSLCCRALTATEGDINGALDFARSQITREVAARLNIMPDDARRYLTNSNYDSEIAVGSWLTDNPKPPLTNRELLLAGIELGCQLADESETLSTFLHIIPNADRQFDFRVIRHFPKYTEEHFGLDYDYAIVDPTTRISRFCPLDWDALSEHLKNLGVGMDDLTAPSSIDSCLLNSPIDAYLVPGRHPHLWQT